MVQNKLNTRQANVGRGEGVFLDRSRFLRRLCSLRCLAVIAVQLAFPAMSFGHSHVGVDLVDTGLSPSARTLAFDDTGEYLFELSKQTVRVHTCDDGSLIRAWSQPISDGSNTIEEASFSRRAMIQICLAFEGKSLIVLTGRGVNIVNLHDAIAGRGTPEKLLRNADFGTHRSISFVCTLGDERVVFRLTEENDDECLALCRVGGNRIIFESRVSLRTDCSSLPGSLYGSGSGNRRAYLVGPKPDESGLIALRVVPDAKHQSFPPAQMSCTAEKLKITWNESNYGSIEVLESFRLPTSPVAVSPNLEQLIVVAGRPLNKSFYEQTLGISATNQVRLRRPVRRIVGEWAQPVGVPGFWSRDGARFFDNDANWSTRIRSVRISVHDNNGDRVCDLPLGNGIAGEVLAASNDGRRVVTKLLRTRPKYVSSGSSKSSSSDFVLWDLADE